MSGLFYAKKKADTRSAKVHVGFSYLVREYAEAMS